MPAAIEIADLSFAYPAPLPGQQPAAALRHISLTIEAGQFVALMGAVGAGKTTLCLCLNGLIPQAVAGEFSGRVVVAGRNTQTTPVAEITASVGLLFQDAEVQLFHASVEDELAFGLENLGWEPAAIERRIDWALEAVGLTGFRRRSPRTLSGGQQKRLAIATLLCVAPPILVLDEPTAGLDARGKAEVLAVIGRLAAERNATVVMATQDAEMAARYADRLIVLDQGQVIMDGAPADIFEQIAAAGPDCVSLPQMAVLAHLLSERLGRRLRFSTPEEARVALWGADLCAKTLR